MLNIVHAVDLVGLQQSGMESGITVILTLLCPGVTCIPFLRMLLPAPAKNVIALETAIDDLSNRLTKLDTDMQNQSQLMTDLKKQLDSIMQPPVAFTVGLSSADADILKDGKVVKFTHVLHNAGNGYNPQTGLFTAPDTGQYLFYIKVAQHPMVRAQHSCVEVNLHRGEQRLITTSFFCSDIPSPSSSLVPLHMIQGDTVHVRILKGVSVSASLQVSLSGMKV